MSKCLICFNSLEPGEIDYHKRCSRKLFGAPSAPKIEYSYGEVRKLAKEVISRRLAIPGVQPKLSLTFENANTKNRLTIVGLWDGLYVLKPPHKSYKELPENEALMMSLAEICKIDVAPHGLIRFKSGEIGYIAKRFDRVVNKKERRLIKLAQEDMCQLTEHLTEDKYHGSAEKISNIIRMFTTNKGFEVSAFMDVLIFCFLTGNADMHLKNFSLLTTEEGDIRLSPAYDLVSTAILDSGDREEMALAINGKKNRINLKDFAALATYSGLPLKSFENALKRFSEALPKMDKKIGQSFLSSKMKNELRALIRSRAKRLGLGGHTRIEE